MRRALVALLAAVSLFAACGDTESSPDTTTTTTSPVPTATELDGRHFEVTAATGFTIAVGSVISISFTKTAVSANAGCNGGGGEYAIKDGKLIVDALVQTEMYCEQPGVMDQEQVVFGLLGESPEIYFVNDLLTIKGKSVTLTLAEPVGGNSGN